MPVQKRLKGLLKRSKKATAVGWLTLGDAFASAGHLERACRCYGEVLALVSSPEEAQQLSEAITRLDTRLLRTQRLVHTVDRATRPPSAPEDPRQSPVLEPEEAPRTSAIMELDTEALQDHITALQARIAELEAQLAQRTEGQA